MNRKLVDWQIIDPETDCVFPWFTWPFLDVLKTWDLSERIVLEYGGGRSTAWWATKAARVVTIEANTDYAESIANELLEKNLLSKSVLLIRPANDDTTDPVRVNFYVNSPDETFIPYNYGIVVVDGIMRHECMMKGLEILRKTGGILIADNWQQDGFVCPASEDLMLPYKEFYHPFVQEDHKDNHGRKWCTAYWDIPKMPTDILYGGEAQ